MLMSIGEFPGRKARYYWESDPPYGCRGCRNLCSLPHPQRRLLSSRRWYAPAHPAGRFRKELSEWPGGESTSRTRLPASDRQAAKL